MPQIKIGNITIEVSFKEIKNVHLSVHPPIGRVTISAPRHFDLPTIKVYAATKLGWIKKQRAKMQQQERESDREYIGRESHYFLGKRYLLEITQSHTAKVILHHTKIELQIPPSFDRKKKEDLLYKFYRNELRTLLKSIIKKQALAMKLEPPSFGIRKMKTKWGSCAIERKFLWFNIELAKKPVSAIEYIAVHELSHLKERNHNKNFTLLLDKFYPNWQIQKQLLNELPL
jgi:predicted metal-dependent hydrolase